MDSFRRTDANRPDILGAPACMARTHADFLPLLLAVGRHGAFVLLSDLDIV